MKMEPELIAKVSTFIATSALGVQQYVLPAQPITLPEIAIALLGGFVAGWALLKLTEPTRSLLWIDKAYTILFSGVIGAMLGPSLTNWAALEFTWVAEGLFENAGGGLVAGAVVPVSFATVMGVIKLGRENPERAIELVRKFKKAVLGR